MLKNYLLFLLIPTLIFSDTPLQRNYYLKARTVFASDLNLSTPSPCLITTFAPNKQLKRISTLQIQKALQACSVSLSVKKQFSILLHITPDIETQPFLDLIQHYYQEHYQTIQIRSIRITALQLTQPLNEHFTLNFSTKSYLRQSSTATIVTSKRIGYVNYHIDASLKLFTFTQDVKSSMLLMPSMLTKQQITLKRFKSKPLEHYPLGEQRLKYHKRIGAILFAKDLKQSYVIKKGDEVAIRSQDGSLFLEFKGIAKQPGYLGSVITVETSRQKRLKAKVIAPFVVELE